jgi:hypothetical protein
MGVSSYVALAKSLRGRRRRRRASRDVIARELELRDALADRGVRVVRYDALPSPDAPIASRRPSRLARELGAACDAVAAAASFAGACVTCLVIVGLMACARGYKYGEGPFDER